MFLSNMAGVGFEEDFSPLGVKNNKKFIVFLKKKTNMKVKIMKSPLENKAGFLSSNTTSYYIKQFLLELGGIHTEPLTWKQRAAILCQTRQIIHLSS